MFDDKGAECLNINTNDHLLWIKSPFSVFAYYAKSNEKATLFIDGESLSMSLSAAEFICNNQSFKWSTLEEMGLEKDIWHELIELQSIIPSSIINSDQYQ